MFPVEYECANHLDKCQATLCGYRWFYMKYPAYSVKTLAL